MAARGVHGDRYNVRNSRFAIQNAEIGALEIAADYGKLEVSAPFRLFAADTYFGTPPAASLTEMTCRGATGTDLSALICANRRTLTNIVLGCLGSLLLFSLIAAIKTQNYRFQLSVGMSADNFLGGFPRVIYGFVCGMLLHRLWSDPSPFPV